MLPLHRGCLLGSAVVKPAPKPTRPIRPFGLLWILLSLVLPGAFAEEPGLVLAHYMPWFQAGNASQKWGVHWTMNHFDPERIRWDGQREAASHDYPLIGLYDSGDPDTLECHALLLKFAGLGGVVIDWYGPEDFNDYALIHRNAERLVPFLKKAGLQFAVCYEDKSADRPAKAGGAAAGDAEAAAHARTALQWLDAHWFADPAYVRRDGRPLLLVFGPQRVDGAALGRLRQGLSANPLLFGLPHLSGPAGFDGLFGWPPVSDGKTSAKADWTRDLDVLDARRRAGEAVLGVAFPGFQDIYAQAGLHPSYGRIEAGDGATFAESLDRALAAHSGVVQLATWNDFGEGTVIEPSNNNGYRYLEKVQKALRAHRRQGPEFHPGDLRLPVALYTLRKRAGARGDLSSELDRASELLFRSECAAAEKLLSKVNARLAVGPAVWPDDTMNPGNGYRLDTEVPYRDGTSAEDPARLHCRLDVYTPSDGKPFNTVVWFHGGGLSKGSRSVPVGLRNKGVGVVTVDYRLTPEVGTEVCIEDAAAAVAWTLQNIGRYGGSAEKVFLAGHSAGGYLACMLALDKSWLGAHSVDANRLAGVIPLSPQAITHFAARKESGIPELQPVIDRFAPLFHVRKDAPPLLLVTGDREKELYGRYEENAYLWRMLKLVKHPDVALHELGGFDHGQMAEPAMPLLLRFVAGHGKSKSGLEERAR